MSKKHIRAIKNQENPSHKIFRWSPSETIIIIQSIINDLNLFVPGETHSINDLTLLKEGIDGRKYSLDLAKHFLRAMEDIKKGEDRCVHQDDIVIENAIEISFFTESANSPQSPGGKILISSVFSSIPTHAWSVSVNTLFIAGYGANLAIPKPFIQCSM